MLSYGFCARESRLAPSPAPVQALDFMRYRLAPVAVLLLLAGCAAGPGPPPAPAAATAGEVEVAASAGAWRGWPAELSRFATPIHVRVVNRGAAPVRLSHDDFALIAGGRRLPAVLPYEVRGVVYAPPPAELPSAGFSLDDPLATRDWVLHGTPAAAEADPARVGEQFALPSPDMLDHALAEGVVQPGARASGFVYFEPLGAPAGPTDLSVRLVDARSGQIIGRAVIPLTLP